MKWRSQSGSSTILLRLSVSLCLMLTACAYGTTKTQVPGIDDNRIQSTRTACTETFSSSTTGRFEDLWANKRDILRRARSCSQEANLLAEQVEAQNKAIKELETSP